MTCVLVPPSELNPFMEIKPKVLDRSNRQKSLGLQTKEKSGFFLIDLYINFKMSEMRHAVCCRFIMIDA